MALWLVRTGRHGEFEQRFLQDNRIYLTWDGLKHDLSKLRGTAAVHEILRETYPNKTKGHLIQNTGQVWAFVGKMKPRGWIVVPSKSKPAINIAEIVGPYVFDGTIENPFYHYRDIKWIAKDIPRPAFDQDLLYSFGAFTTVCQIAHNDAEKRVRAMASVGWKSVLKPAQIEGETEAELAGEVDLEQLARDQIAKLVIQKFKGHGLARLVDAILKAQGYTTYLSPEGPDKGIDILAALGPLGFGKPRLCVQVKSGDSPVDSATLNQLIGAMQNVQADQGLLVSWGGFRSSVDREVVAQFFRVRLWGQDVLIEELLANYDKLDADLRAELPFKRIWTVTMPEDTE